MEEVLKNKVLIDTIKALPLGKWVLYRAADKPGEHHLEEEQLYLRLHERI